MLCSGADVNQRSSADENALHSVARSEAGSLLVAKALVQAGATVDKMTIQVRDPASTPCVTRRCDMHRWRVAARTPVRGMAGVAMHPRK